MDLLQHAKLIMEGASANENTMPISSLDNNCFGSDFIFFLPGSDMIFFVLVSVSNLNGREVFGCC